jgi:hypothetical protein
MAPIGSCGGAAQSSAEQASPHRRSGLGHAHGGGKASGRAVAVGGGKQRSVGAALTRENRGGVGAVSVGVDGRRKAMAMRTAWSAYPVAMTEVAARTGWRHDRGGAMTAQRFYLTNGG